MDGRSGLKALLLYNNSVLERVKTSFHHTSRCPFAQKRQWKVNFRLLSPPTLLGSRPTMQGSRLRWCVICFFIGAQLDTRASGPALARTHRVLFERAQDRGRAVLTP